MQSQAVQIYYSEISRETDPEDIPRSLQREI